MVPLIARDLLKLICPGGAHVLTSATLTFGWQQEFIASGPVEIRPDGKTGFTYKMQATKFDLAATNRANSLREENLYTPQLWPRIDGIDAQGRLWTVTRLKPAYDIANDTEIPTIFVMGATNSLSGVQKTARSFTSRHEAIFDLSQYPETANRMGYMVGSLKTIEVSGTTIWLHFDHQSDTLHVTSLYSECCPQPYLDSWIFEPLQILFGLPLEPIITVRVPSANAWRTQLHIRPNPLVGEELETGLWTFARSQTDRKIFWNWYERLFEYFSSHRDDNQSMSFYCLPLTRYYYELQIASQKTIWLRSVAYAATLESLAKHLIPAEKHDLPDGEIQAIQEIKRYLKKYRREDVVPNQREVDVRLIGRLHQSLAYLPTLSARKRLLELVNQGVLRPEHEQSWSNVRNHAMHGYLGTAWSTEEGDLDTRRLMEAVARITCELVGIEQSSLRSFKELGQTTN